MVKMLVLLCRVYSFLYVEANKEFMHVILELQGTLGFFAVIFILTNSRHLKIDTYILPLGFTEDTSIRLFIPF